MKRALLACAMVAALPASAEAFCGFYVDGEGSKLYNNATQVVMMREGTRTVLAMQNNYQGPPADFAMVVPVPVVLQKDDVKTLPAAVFERVDKLAAPRLVEYWEQDPCEQLRYQKSSSADRRVRRPSAAPAGEAPADDLGVTIEAQFEVGEYQIVILSAKEATGLETWLGQEGYKIPAGASAHLKPYVESGSKFFVAKVDIEKVAKDASGRTMLSPLRFHYDTEQFALPVRLGLMNAKDKQDLIVHIIARGQRYQTANYKNAFIPTNIDVKATTKGQFATFYAALFDATVEKNPGAVITEYAWDASTCDPCPTPALSYAELATLGLDVLDGGGTTAAKPAAGAPNPNLRARRAPPRRPPRRMGGFVLTRLHVRYGAADLKDDLVFTKADPIVGGREHVMSAGKLEEGAKPGGMNNFQARYAIRHKWTGPVTCDNPTYGRWGGPPSGGHRGPEPATDLAFAPRGTLKLATVVAQDVPELGVIAAAAAPAKQDPADPAPPKAPAEGDTKKSKGCATGGGSGGALALVLVGLALLRRRRRA